MEDGSRVKGMLVVNSKKMGVCFERGELRQIYAVQGVIHTTRESSEMKRLPICRECFDEYPE